MEITPELELRMLLDPLKLFLRAYVETTGVVLTEEEFIDTKSVHQAKLSLKGIRLCRLTPDRGLFWLGKPYDSLMIARLSPQSTTRIRAPHPATPEEILSLDNEAAVNILADLSPNLSHRMGILQRGAAGCWCIVSVCVAIKEQRHLLGLRSVPHGG